MTAWRRAAGWFGAAVGLPLLFWLRYGVIDGFAIGFTAFLLLLALGVEVGLRQTERLGPFSRASELQPGPYDFLGVVWLLLIPFGPLASWMLVSLAEPDVRNWYALAMATVLLCVAGPLVCVWPLVPYVRGKPAAFMAGVLLLGTAYPVLCGAWALYDVIEGPAWETVQIAELRHLTGRGANTTASARETHVMLEDGRRLTRAPGLALHPGPARLLILRGYRHVLAVGR